jgi:hypothetical protein
MAGLFDYQSPENMRAARLKPLLVSGAQMGQQQLLSQLVSQMSNAGANIGATGAGMLGLQLPEEARQQQVQSIMQGVDLTSAEGLTGAAKQFADMGETKYAQELMSKANSIDDRAMARQKFDFDMKPKPNKPSDIQTLLTERENFPLGSPQRALFDKKLAVLTQDATAGKAPTTHKFEKGSETIYQQWDSAAGAWKELGRAPRSIGGQEPDSVQNLKFQAKRIGCDLNDPACYEQARNEVVKLKRADTPAGQIQVANVTRMNESLTTARGLSERVGKIDKAFETLSGKDGKPLVGIFSDMKVASAKFGELFGISNNKAVQATEALKSNNMALAGELLASGMFGAGTGISDRDMETALQMAGADMALSYDGMVRILQNLREQAIGKLNRYNNDVNNTSNDLITATGYSRDRFVVPVPEPFVNVPASAGIPGQGGGQGTPSQATKRFNPATGKLEVIGG